MPGANGKMMKGKGGKWEEVPDDEMDGVEAAGWTKDKDGKWVNPVLGDKKPWDNYTKKEEIQLEDDEPETT